MQEKEKPFLDPQYWRKAAELDPDLHNAFVSAWEEYLVRKIVESYEGEEKNNYLDLVSDLETIGEFENIAKQLNLYEGFQGSPEALRIYHHMRSN